jgi:hypothetical protein
MDLSGLVDMHIHTAPDDVPRLLDDLEAARQAAAVGMRAILLKSHVTCTADRAAIAEKVVKGISVRGSLVLNCAVGGLNPAAVEAALRLGAKMVYMPTRSARASDGRKGNLTVWEPGTEGKLSTAVLDIISLIAEADAALGTGHLSVPETVAVVKAARDAGSRKIVVTHPDSFLVNMPLTVRQELAGLGAYFEHCYFNLYPPANDISFEELAYRIRSVGLERAAVSTDFGEVDRPAPVVGLSEFVSGLLRQGFIPAEVRCMAGETPAMLIGL